MPDTIEERVAYLEGTVNNNSRNIEDLRELMVQLNRRVDHLDQKVDRFREELADRISTLEQSTNKRINGLEQSTNARIDALDKKMSRQFMWLVGIQVAILLAVVGALLGGG